MSHTKYIYICKSWIITWPRYALFYLFSLYDMDIAKDHVAKCLDNNLVVAFYEGLSGKSSTHVLCLYKHSILPILLQLKTIKALR